MFLELLANIPKDSPSEVEIEGTKVQNLSGQKFGKLTVLYPCQNLGKGRYKYYCICDCGNYTIKEGGNLRRLMSTSCGCNRKGKGKTKDERKSDPLVELTCPVCGTKFYRKQSRIDKLANTPCCSHSCSRKNCKPRSWKPAVFRDLYGNFLFNQDDLDQLRESGNTLEKVLSVRCLECGDIFKISYSEYQDIVSRHDKGILAGRFCSQACFGQNVSKDQNVIDKRKQTVLERYGGSVMSNEEVRAKAIKTNLEKYGVENPNQSKSVRLKTRRTNREKFYNAFIEKIAKKKITLLLTKEQYVIAEPLKYKCERCGGEWETPVSTPKLVYCPHCFKQHISKCEKDLASFIKSIYKGVIIENDRTILGGKELDIYLPDLKLAFEFDGNYWHSSFMRTTKYHQDKSLECREQGIRLIHIFEYEWINEDKRRKLEAFIKTCLGQYEKRIHGRKCIVGDITSRQYSDFLEENHLQGKVNSSLRKGLFYEDQLVAVIGFGKNRYSNSNVLELHRFCVKLGYAVVGGFSKLIKGCQVESFTSYIDLAKYDGKGYFAIGCQLLDVTQPNYVYVKNDEVYTRIQCQKHKLEKMLMLFDSKLTEQENMFSNKFLQVYDSGNLHVIWKQK